MTSLPATAVRRRAAFAAAAAASLALALADPASRSGVLAGSVLVMLAALPTALRLRADPVDGPGIYAAMSGVCFGLLSLAWLGTPPIPAPGVDRGGIVQALLIVAGALVAFGVAARAAGGRAVRRDGPLAEIREPPVHLIVALFALGVAGLGAGILLRAVGVASDTGAGGAVTPYAQVFQQLGVLGALAVLVLALVLMRNPDPRLRRLLIALAAVQMVAGFMSGFKQQALLPVIYVVLAYVLSRGRVPWRVVGAGAAIFLFVLVPATILYRAALTPPDDGRDPASPRALATQTWEYFGVRFRLVDHVALIRDRTPGVYPYGNGSRYVQLPALVLVPRALWPEKPILDDGLEFSHSYWEVPPHIRTSTPLTQVGDLLRNFGVAGVAGGMLLWGAVVGGATALWRRRRSPRLDMVYIVALPSGIAYVESDLPQLVAGASKSLLVAAAVAWLLLPGRRGRSGYAWLRQLGRSLVPAPASRLARAEGAGRRG